MLIGINIWHYIYIIYSTPALTTSVQLPVLRVAVLYPVLANVRIS
jgi:hypothetical protein